MVEEMLAARGITVSHETVRQWALKFGQGFANRIRRRLPSAGDKWHLDEVQITIAGEKHCKRCLKPTLRGSWQGRGCGNPSRGGSCSYAYS